MVIYIKEQGARIVKEGKHLLVKKGDATCHTLFTYKLKQVVIFGNVEITHRALAQLMRQEIDTVFLTQSGRYLGRISSSESRNVFLRKRQYDLLNDHEFTLRMAKSIVAGKFSNMATLLMRIKRTKDAKIAAQKAREIHDLFQPLQKATTLESIRGYEGRGSALYFEGFAQGFVGDMGFSKRVRRPPTDPVNSVLSLLYTFLMNRVYAAIRVASLDPYPGFLHTIDYGRYSLVLDLMEEFRTIIVDTLTLSLFNLKILKQDDFYTEKPTILEPSDPETKVSPSDVTKDPIGLISPIAEDEELFNLPDQRMEEDPVVPKSFVKYPVKLHDHAMRKVIEAFEKKLTTEFYYPLAERRMTYGDAIIFQANQFRKVIEGEATTYQPLLLK